MNNKFKYVLMAVGAVAVLAGCHSVYQPARADSKELQREETIVFVRPADYTWMLGTSSLRDYVEVMYEKSSLNSAGFLQVQIGLRNRGGQHLWDGSGPNYITLNAQTKFFTQPLISGGSMSVPVYETNFQQVTLGRGAVHDYKVICPVKEARYYQVILSDALSK